MEFEVLGPLRVSSEAGPLELGAPTQRMLLAVLLTAPNVAIGDERLVDELWGDAPPASAHHALQVYASRLRGLLGDLADGPRLVREGIGYALRVGPTELDAERFVAAYAQGRALQDRDPQAAEQILADAMRLWRGAAFADVLEPPPAVRDDVAYLERQHLEAFETWVDIRLGLGRHHEVVPELADLVAHHPYEEALHAQLMLALYRCGRQTEALQVARTLETRLREQLGIDPSPQVREMYRDILLQSATLALEAPEPPCNLPARLTSFVGRTRELEEVCRLLEGNRLVTLTGPGGIGKTRLAMEVAERLRSRFAGGVWWIDLAPVRETERVVDEVATVLGVAATPGTELVDALVLALRGRSTLLLIDNCEQLAGAVATLVAHLLRSTTGPRVLATSRTPLRVEGERRWTVTPLAVPAEEAEADELIDCEAVRLFVERGQGVDPSFALDAAGAKVVAEVCRRLDGLPLAIEMAAARLPVLTPREIADHLDERFALLEVATVGRLTRHRTLQAALDASHTLLSEDERMVFARLSVFVGSFDLDAAAAVGLPERHPSRSALDLVTALVEASMLTALRAGDQTRYRMLETLREYGSDRLRADGGEGAARRAHAHYYLDLAARAGAVGGTPDFAPWMDRLTDGYAEIREALAWSLAHEDPGLTLRAVPALREFWYRHGDAREAGRWTARMLARDLEAVPPNLRAEVHLAAGFAAALATDVPAAVSHADEALKLSRDTGEARRVIVALWNQAQTAVVAGDLDTARRCAIEALETCDRHGDRWLRAGPLSVLGYASLFGGSPDEARPCLEEALLLYRELGDLGSAGLMALVPLSLAARSQKDLRAAERYATEAVEVAGGTGWEAQALGVYGEALTALGDLDGAETVVRRALRVALHAGLEYAYRMALMNLARIAAERHRWEDAATLFGAGRHNIPTYAADAGGFRPIEDQCRAALGDDRFHELAEHGDAMTHDQLVDLAPIS